MTPIQAAAEKKKKDELNKFDLERFQQGWTDSMRRMLCAGFRSGFDAAFLAGHSYTMEAYGVEELAKALREILKKLSSEITIKNGVFMVVDLTAALAVLEKYDLMDGKNNEE